MRAAAWMCALYAVASADCASTRSVGPAPGACQGRPVEFGVETRSDLGFRVVTEWGRPFVGFWARWRRDSYLLLPGPWSDWEQSDADAEGVFGITDMDEGKYEFEICPPGCEPLHGFIVVRSGAATGYAGAPIVARAGPDSLAAAEHCGVEVGQGVSREQAWCIALTAGLSAGLEPWVERIDPAQPGQKSARWEVLSTNEAGPECPAGEEMIVDARDGRVTGPIPWNCHLDGAVRR